MENKRLHIVEPDIKGRCHLQQDVTTRHMFPSFKLSAFQRDHSLCNFQVLLFIFTNDHSHMTYSLATTGDVILPPIPPSRKPKERPVK